MRLTCSLVRVCSRVRTKHEHRKLGQLDYRDTIVPSFPEGAWNTHQKKYKTWVLPKHR